MARAKTAWGIDIGQCALKALKLVDYGAGEDPQVDAFEIIEHAQNLSDPEADRDQLIRQSLSELLLRHNMSGSRVALAMPGQSSFTRFFKPPPVEVKELPRLIQFEARQQIPFPIDEVIWRWQVFQEFDSPELEVGIFAMKRLDVTEAVSHLDAAGVAVDLVQISPLALYNFMIYDGQVSQKDATLLVNIGADTTDLVVADSGRTWTRTIQIGGNNFTEALSKSFKLSFGKAETLKRTAATSKYARQVFQVMRPVFADFVQEIQRSIGYYITLHRESKFVKLLGLGNGFRLPGLQKFLEQNLNIPVVRIDNYKKLTPTSGGNVPQFNEGVLSFATTYGLAIQLLRPVPVSTNLLPEDIARRRLWVRKIPWFGATAAVVLLALTCPAYRSYVDRKALGDPRQMDAVQEITRDMESLRAEFDRLKNDGLTERREIDKYIGLQGYRNTLPSIQAFVARTIRRVTAMGGGPDVQQMLADYVDAPNFDARKAVRDAIRQIPRSDRRGIYVWRIDCRYVSNVNAVGAAAALAAATTAPASAAPQGGGGFVVTLTASTPLREDKAIAMTGDLEDAGEQTIQDQDLSSLSLVKFEKDQLAVAIKDIMPAGIPIGGSYITQDPFLPEETVSQDMYFVVSWVLALTDDGLTEPDESVQAPEAAN